MDINEQRLKESAIVAGKLIATLGVPATVSTFTDQRASLDGRRLRRRRLPDRRLRALHRHRLRGAEEIRPAADHRRHARRRRHHARPPDGAAPLGDLRGHARRLPGRDHAPVRQPDGDQHLGDHGEVPGDPPGRPLPLGAGHGDGARPRSRHPLREHPLPRRRHQPHGVLPQVRGGHGRRQPPQPLPRSRPRLSRGPRAEAGLEPALPQQGALRDAHPARLFRHRELGAFRRIHAVVHQARPAGPDRDASASRSTNIPSAASSRSRAGRRRRRNIATRRHDRGQGEPRICVLDHQLGVDRRALGDLRQPPQQRLHHLAAGRRGRRGALPRRPERRPADLYRRPAAAAHGADPHQPQRAGTDRARR